VAELLRARRQHPAIKEWRLALKYAPQDAHLSEEPLLPCIRRATIPPRSRWSMTFCGTIQRQPR
jgi:hypothetical protein